MAFDLDVHRLSVGFPDASANPVLSKCLDRQPTMAGFHGPLDLFFQNP
jgi:hypothetical protein